MASPKVGCIYTTGYEDRLFIVTKVYGKHYDYMWLNCIDDFEVRRNSNRNTKKKYFDYRMVVPTSSLTKLLFT